MCWQKGTINLDAQVKNHILAESKIAHCLRARTDFICFQDFDEDFLALEEAAENDRLKSLQEYKKLAEQTKNVRLDKLIQVNQTTLFKIITLLPHCCNRTKRN